MKKIIGIVYIVLVVALAFCKSYTSWWMILLWAALAVLGTAYIIRRKVKKFPIVLLHLSFLIILAGAMTTHLTQIKGTMHLRQGYPTTNFTDEKGKLQMVSFALRLDTFYITSKPDTHEITDFTSKVTVFNKEHPDGFPGVISMNHILKVGNVRFYQANFDEDLRGSVLTLNRDPWGIPITYTGYILMGISFIWMLLAGKRRKLFFYSLCLAAVVAFLFSRKNYEMPILNTWLLPVHVSLVITAYLMFVVAVWYRKMLNVALALLTMGIFIGAYWANISWGTYWSWDPKETWALITMLVYAVPAHKASLPIFQNDKFYRIYMIAGLLSIAMTYWGVNYLMGGMHSYGA